MVHSETERAYLAGLIDGEGSIGINNFGGKRVPAVRVTITNTNIGVLEELQVIWGGAVTTRRIRRIGWKAASDLLWAAKTATQILEEIQPYLKIKRKQCRLALEFQKTVNPREHRTRRLSLETHEYRQELRGRMKQLNARGATS